MKRLICLFLIFSLTSGCTLKETPASYSRTEPLMGTFLEVKVFSQDLDKATLAAITGEAFDLGNKLEEALSAYNPESEVNRLNTSGRIKASQELFFVLEEAGKINTLTNGEFDPTVAPVLKKSGFYDGMLPELLNRIPVSFSGIGWHNVELNPESKEVVLKNGAWLDLSGIAKGYIVDEISSFLKAKEVSSFLVNAGGDIYCTEKLDGMGWKIGVRQPASNDIACILYVQSTAVVTSGDYENVVIDKETGRPISHIIDPLTDEAILEVPSSVTVVASSCTRADALATGMLAMGEEKAVKLADSLSSVDIIVVGVPGEAGKIIYSEGARKHVLGR